MFQRWEAAPSIAAAQRRAPAAPGVYAIGEVATLHGLIVRFDVAYIGKAVTLPQRLPCHTVAREVNPILLQFLLDVEDLEIRWSQTSTEAEALELEAALIGLLNPPANRLLRTA